MWRGEKREVKDRTVGNANIGGGGAALKQTEE